VPRIAAGHGLDENGLGPALKTSGRAQAAGCSAVEFKDIVGVVVPAHGGTRFVTGVRCQCATVPGYNPGAWKGCSRNFSRHPWRLKTYDARLRRLVGAPRPGAHSNKKYVPPGPDFCARSLSKPWMSWISRISICSDSRVIPTSLDQFLRAVVTAFAQALQTTEPKLIPVTTVRLNVISDGRRHWRAVALQAHFAQWMRV